ncbi:MAG: TetR/AcrR family transcriptional regulator [Cyanobacteria bacterium J06628_6]
MARPQKITNEEILAAARQVFIEQGLGASTSMIAERAGISEASIFKRFNTKQALFMAAMGIDPNPPWIKLITQQPPGSDMKARLRDIFGQMLEFYQDVLPRMMIMMANRTIPTPAQFFPPPPVRDSQLLADYLERAIAAGYLRPCNANAVSAMIVGGLVNYSMTRAIFTRFHDQLPIPLPMPLTMPAEPQQFVSDLAEVLWSGIAPD